MFLCLLILSEHKHRIKFFPMGEFWWILDVILQKNFLDSANFTFSIGGQGPSVRASTFCSICREVDHTAASSVLGYLH